MTPSHHELVLFPADPAFAVEERAVFLQELRLLGLVGKCFAPGRYLPGEDFLELIAFLGCSPAIGLSPEQDKQFCHLLYPPILSAPALHYGSNCKLPRCGACGKIATASLQTAGRIACRHCGVAQPLTELDWRRSACVARNPLIVCNVYESEAVPAAGLLRGLRQTSGVGWDYCYIRDRLKSSS